MNRENYKQSAPGFRFPAAAKLLNVFVILLVFTCTFVYAQPSEIWQRTYNNPNGVGNDYCDKTIVDANGNIYVAASTRTANNSDDIMLVKYNSAGTRQWTKTYNYSYNGIEQPNDICFDGSGNIYVTGTSTRGPGGYYDAILLKFDTNGNIIWVKRINRTNFSDRKAEGVSLVVRDGIYAGINFIYDDYTECGIAKYTLNGDSVSYISFGSVNNFSYRMIKMIKDNSLSIYAVCTGEVIPNEEKDILVKKINTNGNFSVEWSKTYTGSSHMNDTPRDIALGPDGNLFVVGSTEASNQGSNTLLLKYGRDDGALLFQKTYNDPVANQSDYATHISFDMNANIIIAGGTTPLNSSADMLFIKYSPSGTQQWVKTYSHPGNRPEGIRDMKMDGADNIYVAADMFDQSAQVTGLLTAKFSSAGVVDWTIEAPGLTPFQGYRNLHILQDGSLIVAGNTDSADVRKILLIKYGSTIGIEPVSGNVPEKFSLSQNYPNPFNPTTNIKLQIPESGLVKLAVFDVTGRQVAELVNETLSAGEYKVDFNASGLTSGVYFYKLTSAGFTETKRMVLVK